MDLVDGLVEIADGLPFGVGFAGDFFAALDGLPISFVADVSLLLLPTLDGVFTSGVAFSCSPLGLRSSATGGNAAPPLTASSLVGSAGFIAPGSSSVAVVGLSGFAGSVSLCASGLSLMPSMAAPLLA